MRQILTSLRAGLLSHGQLPLPLLQVVQQQFAFLCQLWLPQGCSAAFEEPRFPLDTFFLPYFRLFSLLFFNLLLDSCSLGELFGEDGGREAGPETQGFNLQLLGVGRDDFGVY